jgi:hypothetical protein
VNGGNGGRGFWLISFSFFYITVIVGKLNEFFRTKKAGSRIVFFTKRTFKFIRIETKFPSTRKFGQKANGHRIVVAAKVKWPDVAT